MKFKILISTSAMLFIHFDLERRWTTKSTNRKLLPKLILLLLPYLLAPQSATQTSTKDTAAEQVHKPVAPFPNRLRNNNKNMHMEKILEMFNQVKLNVSLLDLSLIHI